MKQIVHKLYRPKWKKTTGCVVNAIANRRENQQVEVSTEELKLALTKLGKNKAVGVDMLPDKIFHKLDKEDVEWLRLKLQK